MRYLHQAVAAAALIATVTSTITASTIIEPTEDVMTSGFFQGNNVVRGYTGDGRDLHRVSTGDPFGISGADTIYVTFDSFGFQGFTGPVSQALLTLESVSGGYSADASVGSPFTVSAHAVSADPLASITDDTNPGGPIDWLTFASSNILPSDAAASTAIDGFGTITFDVTAIVNDWIAGTNTAFAIALTGQNDTSGGDFLHGFLNNTENPGSTFLTVVPEPASIGLVLVGTVVLAGRRRR